MYGVAGVLCGVDMCDLFPAVAGVAASLSFMINHLSTNSRTVVVEVVRTCGPGASDFACLVANHPTPTPEVTVCSLMYHLCIVVVVIVLRGGSCDCHGEV